MNSLSSESELKPLKRFAGIQNIPRDLRSNLNFNLLHLRLLFIYCFAGMKQYLPIMDLLSQFDLELQAVDYLGHVKF